MKIHLLLIILLTNIFVARSNSHEILVNTENINQDTLSPVTVNISQDSLLSLCKRLPIIRRQSYFSNQYLLNMPSHRFIKLGEKQKIITPDQDTLNVKIKQYYIIFNKAKGNGYESTYIFVNQQNQQIFILVSSSYSDGSNCVQETNSLFKFDTSIQKLTDITPKLIEKMAALYELESTEKTQSLFYIATYAEGFELRPNVRCIEFRAPNNVKMPNPNIRKLIPIEEIRTW